MLSDSAMRCISSGGAKAEAMLGAWVQAAQQFYSQSASVGQISLNDV